MYKVFFNDRTVFFDKDFSGSFKNCRGLFYRYGNKGELQALINAYYDLEVIKTLYIFHSDVEFVWNEFISCFRIIEASGGLVRNPDRQVLVIRRDGKWDLPKGKKENDESCKETALREVSEECGITELQLGKFITNTWHTYKMNGENILKRTRWYEMYTSAKEKPVPQVKENITEIRWALPGEMDFVLKNTYPSIVNVLEDAGVISG